MRHTHDLRRSLIIRRTVAVAVAAPAIAVGAAAVGSGNTPWFLGTHPAAATVAGSGPVAGRPAAGDNTPWRAPV